MENILQWISQYGYFAIFSLLVFGIVGLPVPDEWLLTFTGYLVYRGDLRLGPAMAAAFLGSCCGITISYMLGHTVGLWFLEKYGPRFHLGKDKLEKAHAWFERAGRWSLTVGYYIPGVRHLTAYVAGASDLEAPVFARFAYSGALIWVSTFIGLGYFVGDRWEAVSGELHKYALISAAGCGVLGLAYWVYARQKAKGKRQKG
jgi:membrane protein DedA with SNARE-associated domain